MPHLTISLAFLLVLSFAFPASAQVGAPLVGQEATVHANYLEVTWEGTEDDEGHFQELVTLGGFSVLGALTPGGTVIGSAQIPVKPPQHPEQTLTPHIVLPGLPDGTFWVVAVKGLTSTTSAPASAWTQIVVNVNNCGSAPLAPTQLQNLPSAGQPVALSWTPAPSGCPASHFLVAAGTQPGLSNVGVIEISGAVTILYGTAPSGKYYVRVHARNTFGISPPSNEVEVNVNQCAGPGPPHSLTATVVNGNHLQLNWSPPASGDLGLLIGYRLIGRVVGNPLAGGFVDIGPVTSLLAGPIAASTYEIQVQAIYKCGGSSPQFGAPSSFVTVTVP